jgi:hypothetical protein
VVCGISVSVIVHDQRAQHTAPPMSDAKGKSGDEQRLFWEYTALGKPTVPTSKRKKGRRGSNSGRKAVG